MKVCLFLLHILAVCFAANISSNIQIQALNDTKIHERNEKPIDIQILSNRTELNNIDDEIINVCEGFGEIGKCVCLDNTVSCLGSPKTLYIRPMKENFILKKYQLMFGEIFILQKGKIFPTSQETIEEIRFESAKIHRIEDGAFDELISLKFLEFRNAGLTKIDENILTLQLGNSLEKLTLFDNQISSLDPSKFKHMKKLKELDFSANALESGTIENLFPESLSTLKNLDLENCNLTYLAEEIFKNLVNLETLNLSDNHFTSIPNAINVLTNLETFSFGSNNIQVFKKNSFSKNTKLQHLRFDNSSELKFVEDCAFCKVRNLKSITFLQSTSLSYIHENAFGSISNGHTPGVIVFSIQDCNISILPEKLLDWKSVRYLEITDNPFACNCSMAWLFKDLLSNNSEFESRLSARFSNYKDKSNLKYRLGCLEPMSTSQNHTMPKIFESCKSSNDDSFSWIFMVLGAIGFAT